MIYFYIVYEEINDLIHPWQIRRTVKSFEEIYKYFLDTMVESKFTLFYYRFSMDGKITLLKEVCHTPIKNKRECINKITDNA